MTYRRSGVFAGAAVLLWGLLWVGCSKDSSYLLISDPAFEVVRTGGVEEKEKSWWKTLVFSSSQELDSLLQVWSRGDDLPQGVMVSPLWGSRWRDVDELGIPVIVLGERDDGAPSLILDRKQALAEAAAGLAEQGSPAGVIFLGGTSSRESEIVHFQESWVAAGGEADQLSVFSLERDRELADLRRFIKMKTEEGVTWFGLFAGRFSSPAWSYLEELQKAEGVLVEGPGSLFSEIPIVKGVVELPFSDIMAGVQSVFEGEDVLGNEGLPVKARFHFLIP